MAISQAGREAMFTDRLIRELGISTNDAVLTVHCDNKQTLLLLTQDQFKLKTALRHVGIHAYWLREQVQLKRIHVEYMSSKEIASDGLTKALSNELFSNFRRQIGVVNIGNRLTVLQDARIDTDVIEDLLFNINTLSIATESNLEGQTAT